MAEELKRPINKVVYAGETLIDLTQDTVVANKMLKDYTAHDKSGAIITGSIESKAAASYTPSTADQTIESGVYLSGDQTIKGDANLVAGSIKSGVSVFGVDGTFTSDATAIAGEVLLGKTAYAKGAKVTGTMPNNGAVNGSIATKDGIYTVPAGYHDGSGKVQIVESEKSKLIAANIRQGITLLGVEGTMSSTEGLNLQAKEVTPSTTSQEIIFDSSEGYNGLSSVTVKPIPFSQTGNEAGGFTVTIG